MGVIGVPGTHSILSLQLIKFEAVCSRLLNRSLIIPIGSVPVEDDDDELTGGAAVDVVVAALAGGELKSVEVVEAVVEGVVVCEVVGCVAPGTGDAEGVDVCAA
jgi:hypothetical protein